MRISRQTTGTFARCAVLDPEAPIHRSTRTHVLSVRFKPIIKASTPRLITSPSPVRTPEPLLATYSRDLTSGRRDIDSVTIAEGDIRARAEGVRYLGQGSVRGAVEKGAHNATPAKTAIDSALRLLTYPRSLRKGQQGDPFLSKVRSNLTSEEMDDNDQDQRIHENYFLDDYDLV